MKIYSLLLIKNEIDIIEPVIKDATQWSDKIIVFDNGSTDGTWEKVIELSKKYSTVIPHIQDSRPFRIGLRAILFEQFKDEMTSEDWWCIRMDADEFYIDSPKEFLSKVPLKYKQVWKDSIDYQLAKEDLEEHTFEGDFSKDESKINYYNKTTWSEIRFLRHSKKLRWNIEQKLPTPRGLIFPQKIRVKHYQFRSPEQLKKRFKTRKDAIAGNCNSFKHEKGENWLFYIKTRSELIKDTRDGAYHTEGSRNKHVRHRNTLLKRLLNLFNFYN